MDEHQITQTQQLQGAPQNQSGEKVYHAEGKKKQYLLVLLGSIIIAICFGAFFLFNKPTKQHVQTPLKQQSNPPEWQTLTSTICHISFQYPKTWKAEKIEQNGCKLTAKDPSDNHSSFMIYTAEAAPNSELAKNKNITLSPITIAGVNGYELSSANNAGNQLLHLYTFNKGKISFNIMAFQKANTPEDTKLRDHILQSIRLNADYENPVF